MHLHEAPRLAPIATLGAGRLAVAERVRLAGEIVAAYLRARRALRRAPIRTALAMLRSPTPSHASQTVSRTALNDARRLGAAVARTLALLPGDTRCLARSLVLTRLLDRRGICATLVIGARTDPDFRAHAWVECGGEPVLAPGDSFTRLVEL
jgi:Transglutaminase-like superfamily